MIFTQSNTYAQAAVERLFLCLHASSGERDLFTSGADVTNP